MGNFLWFFLLCLVWSSLILGTNQLQPSETQVLLQLREQLEYPIQLEIWKDHSVDFCFLLPTKTVNLTCQDNLVTELKITGDKTHKVENFVGFALEPHTLSANFSLDSLVATLARLTSLRVLWLWSLGIWGPLPDKIHLLRSLETLYFDSNYLYGSVPPEISAMPKLKILGLSYNFINDTFPDWFVSMTNLTILRLSNNKLKGKLPNFDSLTNLDVLDLGANQLYSSLPSMPKSLEVLYLENNSFLGEIPREYTELTLLQGLDLSFNELTGKIPAALFGLPHMSVLNLASNMLTGSLPNELNCSWELYARISYNFLTGKSPYCLNNESEPVIEFDWNCMSANSSQQRPESSCVRFSMPEKSSKSRGKGVGTLAGVICGIVLFTITMLLCFCFLVKRCCKRETSEQHLLEKPVQENSGARFSPEILLHARFISPPEKMEPQGAPMYHSFTVQDLKEATNNFDSAAILGEGTYGPLYKGRLVDGSQVAIRCISASKKYTNRNLKLRLDLLTKLHHPNLVRLLGHCICGGQDGCNVNKLFLVYEYILNGELSLHLREDNPGKVLNWSERLEVLISIAKAVQFLHKGVIPGFFNNRLKVNNILLNEYGIAKLSDYGLSFISAETGESEEGEDGNRPRQMARLEDDVYSFGLMMLESLVSSMSARRDTLLLDELASCASTGKGGTKKLINPVALATCSQESLSVVIGIAKKCISESWNRPSFEDIIWNLKYAAEVQATADGKKV